MRISFTNPHSSLRMTIGDKPNDIPSIDLDDAVADGVEREIGDGVEIEFSHQVGAVSFGGFDAQAKSRGDLFSGFSFGDQLNHFALAGSQNVLVRSLVLLVGTRDSRRASSARLLK